jgi:hypothetical protein
MHVILGVLHAEAYADSAVRFLIRKTEGEQDMALVPGI